MKEEKPRAIRERLRKLDEDMHRRAPLFWRFLKFRFRRGERYGLGFTVAFAAIAAALWGFLEVVEAVADERTLYQFDFRVQELIASILTPALTAWFIRITFLGNTWSIVGWVALVGTVLLVTRRWWSLFGLVFATAGGGLVLRGLKAFFRRARPDDPIIDVPGFSFPSGHAFGSMVLFGYFIYLAWRHIHSPFWRILIACCCTVLILLIGTSRVYLNVHWLTDILGGFAAGFIWLISSILIRHVAEPRLTRR